MAVESPSSLFELLLGNALHNAARTARALEELGRQVEEKNIEDALMAQVFVLDSNAGLLGQCFRLLGGEQTEFGCQLPEVCMEEYRKELAEIESPTAKSLLVLAKTSTLTHLAIGEYTTLIAIAEMTGHCGVGVLLDSCRSQNKVFVERIKRLIEIIVEGSRDAFRRC